MLKQIFLLIAYTIACFSGTLFICVSLEDFASAMFASIAWVAIVYMFWQLVDSNLNRG